MSAALDRVCARLSSLGGRTDEISVATARTGLRMRAQQNVVAIRIGLLASTIIFAAMLPLAPWTSLLGWLVGNNLALWWSGAVSSRFLPRIDQADARAIARMEAAILGTLVVSTTAFASGLWWVGQQGSSTDPGFVVTTLLQMRLVGTMITYSSHALALFTAVGIGSGAALVYWAQAGSAGLAICASLLGLVALMVRFSKLYGPILERNVRTAYENAGLVARLETANASKSRFLAAASHDLRQPIHALVLFSDALTRSARPDQGEVAIGIRHAVASLDKLLGGLLDLSQMDAGALKPHPVAYAIEPWLHEISRDFFRDAGEKGLTLSVQATDAWVLSDAFLLERVVRNLLDNAIKYTHAGAVGVTCAVDGDVVTLEVWDTGVGIPSDALKHVFEEFTQLDNPHRDAARGAGLGLTIVHRLCGILDHPLYVRSSLGEGSSFVVTLPRAAPEPAREAPPAPAGFAPSAALRGRRVVVLDDDPRVRAAMRGLLDGWGVDGRIVGTAEHLHEALRNADALPDALIIDFRLPGEHNGFDVIRQVQSRYGAVPAAIFTGESELSLPADAAMQDVPVFVKPVRPEEIGAWLEDAIATSARD